MIKRILILCILLAVTAYLIVAVTVFNRKPENQVCKGMELVVKDSIDYGFITETEVKNLLKQKNLYPEKKRIGTINVRLLEETLSRHPFISKAECYLTSGGKVGIEVYQRIPILRIMSSNGDNYYIDQSGKIMSAAGKSVHVAVATGFIDRKFAQNELYQLGLYLQQNPFWKAQVEQINVTPRKELEIVPRVGDHILFLGKATDFEGKFSKLQTFYSKVLNRIGWNKYERISIEFNNQIIGTKKEE
jgi:cell division protein FtsQ